MPAQVRRSFAVCLLVLSFLILGQTSPAAAAAWTWAGPDGGPVYSLALQPGSSSVLYAGAQGGVFKSLDGGATWLPPGEGMPAAVALDIALDPGHPATVYAVLALEGLYKSSDAGAHWIYAGAVLPGPPSQQSVHAVAITPGGTVYAGTDAGVFRSQNGGSSWLTANRGLPPGSQINALEIDPSRPERILAGLSGQGIYRTTNGGARWSRAGGAAQDRIVYELAFAPSKVVYAATEAGVLSSLDSGATWAQSGLTSFTTSVAAHPTLPETVYAGTPEGVFRSTDRGATWLRVSDGLSDPMVQALAIDPAHPTTLWAGTGSHDRLGGVFQTTDAGAHWVFRSNGLHTIHVASLAVDPHNPGTLFAALSSAGLVRSRDRGLHWTPLPIPEGLSILDVEVDPVDSSIVYAAVGSIGGPLLKSTDGGDTWTRLGTPPDALFELEIDPVNPAVLHGGSFNGFWRSTDAGATWVQSPSFPFITPLQLEIAPGVLYATARWPPVSGTPGANLTQMLRSTDAGQTWQTVLDFSQVHLSFAVSPSDPKTVYAIRRTGPVLRSTDSGNTWETVGLLPGAVSLAIAAGSPETLYAAVAGQGVLASTDGGATWSPVGQGLAGLSFGEIVLDPQEPARLYVTVAHRGIATPYEPEECEPGPAMLCLRGRFRIEVAWADFQGNTGSGQAIPMTHETGGFWFFDPANVELVVKVLDGRDINGRFWVFAASLTSVEFTLTVTDMETGERRVYYNPSGNMASFGDTEAF